jgi:hypothetical protein
MLEGIDTAALFAWEVSAYNSSFENFFGQQVYLFD